MLRKTLGIICIGICVLMSTSCKYKRSSDKLDLYEPKKGECMSFVIQPFDDLSTSLADSLFDQLKLINPNAVLNKPIPLPQKAYYKAHNRYRADTLLRYLWNKSTYTSVVIGVTSKDISTTHGDIDDWGVMGLAFMPGHSCMVSTYRLSKKNLVEQLYKVSIHELGHTQGLPHCETGDEACFMQDAKGRNRKDELTHFCNYCKLHLIQKGWLLDQ